MSLQFKASAFQHRCSEDEKTNCQLISVELTSADEVMIFVSNYDNEKLNAILTVEQFAEFVSSVNAVQRVVENTYQGEIVI